MADGAGQAAWARASMLAAVIVNCNRDPKKGRPAQPKDFNPYHARRDTVRVDRLSDIKDEFAGFRKRPGGAARKAP